jgi:hypothetical protein
LYAGNALDQFAPRIEGLIMNVVKADRALIAGSRGAAVVGSLGSGEGVDTAAR